MKTITDKNGVLFDTVMISYANQLNLELHESSFANFECNTRNSYPFNRLFAVSFSNGKPSVVSNYETGEQLEMKPGHLYFFSCGFPLAFHFREGTGFFAFHFNLRYCAYQDVFLSERFMRELYDPEFIKVLETEFKNASDISAAFLIKGLLFQKVSKIFPKEKQLFREDSFHKYRELFEYISKHVSAKLTVAELAEVSGMTRDLLSKNFSRDIGIPLKKYLSNILLSRAELLLRNKELTVREIARLLNFNDEYYFSHFFRRQTGLAPGQYRKQQIEIFKQ